MLTLIFCSFSLTFLMTIFSCGLVSIITTPIMKTIATMLKLTHICTFAVLYIGHVGPIVQLMPAIFLSEMLNIQTRIAITIDMPIMSIPTFLFSILFAVSIQAFGI